MVLLQSKWFAFLDLLLIHNSVSRKRSDHECFLHIWNLSKDNITKGLNQMFVFVNILKEDEVLLSLEAFVCNIEE